LVVSETSLTFDLSLTKKAFYMNIENRVSEILTTHGLDFKIDKNPLTSVYNGGVIETPYFGLFNSKTGECIHAVKKSYTPSQNDKIVEAVLRGMEGFGDKLTVNKAGALNGGRQVYIQLGIEGNSIVNNDVIKQNVTIIDSNDGTSSLSVGISDTVMHCQNQFYKFYAEGNQRFRHSSGINEKIDTIPQLIEVALNECIKQVKIYKRFESTTLTKGLADKLVKEILGCDKLFTSIEERTKLSTRSINLMDTLYQDIETETNIVGENLWGLFNGITRFTTHSTTTKKSNENKDKHLILGSGYVKNLKAFNFLLDEVNN
jgi:hypothetical protein